MPNVITKYGKNGKVSYQAVVRVDVRRPVKKTFDTFEEAEAWRVAKDAELRANLEQPAYEFTLDEVLDDFSTYYPKADVEQLKTAIPDLLTATLLAIEPENLENLDDAELKTLEEAIEHGRKFFGAVIPENPVTMLRARRAKLPFRPTTQYEAERLIEDAGDLANGALKDVLILALDTAMALTEILEIKDNQFDNRNGILRLTETRVIKLTDRAKEVIARRSKANKGTLFAGTNRNTVQTAFIRLRKYIGINGPDFNDIRKIAIMRLATLMPIQELKATLGYARYDSLQWLLDLQADNP
ncbi:tyrosine-type recombinase/integrase [Burkholderia cenocepacia]|uniref:tyrosine-type recombinase/integrase n=1 Tax=Burkholderia cenocepacia TaxID=95486 RepID=UPI0024B6B655|nr:tyrosine-type recombinase/integrase [Burkholderia cenocepacia]MDI9686576.1 hypothetical protein [Burkholderia cenocepacia]